MDESVSEIEGTFPMNFINLNYQTITSEEERKKLFKDGCYTGVNRSRYRKRFLRKDGNCNIHFKGMLNEWGSYFSDIFTTLIDLKWSHIFVIFSLSYILSWLFFGFVYWVMSAIHGDLGVGESEHTPCIAEVHTFTAAFLFAIETQTTIGYGLRCVTEECPFTVTMVTCQSVTKYLINSFIIGAVVAKMAKARKRAQKTIGFSNNAVVAMRDGKLCLMWRLGDFRESHVIEGTITAQLLRFQETGDNQMTMEHQQLRLTTESVILVSPVIVEHAIDEHSPLYDLGQSLLAEDDFELIITFLCSGDSTGSAHQSRSSYTPLEILWGHRFKEILKDKNNYLKVSYSEFHRTQEVSTPACSARELYTASEPLGVLSVAGLDSCSPDYESLAAPSQGREPEGEQELEYKKPLFLSKIFNMESEL
ncbi:inward rectifier potassium channel 16 [Callorhinchus milii]|uniref:Potassium inwardly rectifying channel subfamily J member 16 n=2 Tax=Callorhinchus milii TaxID=7868 RepID=A0A4W3JTC0_CALMI|nr:inward rectifier potassium channel 16 [Callorhinchus milii]|eukprot:gi/632943210/ref/XP_007886828.1/ PREDICTED: inward rectifier potassium channel 16 [Callorhinchus milii]